MPFGAIEALKSGVRITYTLMSGQCSPPKRQAMSWM
jgi:hypothetical protein